MFAVSLLGAKALSQNLSLLFFMPRLPPMLGEHERPRYPWCAFMTRSAVPDLVIMMALTNILVTLSGYKVLPAAEPTSSLHCTP
jgi:hypothetical protein